MAGRTLGGKSELEAGALVELKQVGAVAQFHFGFISRDVGVSFPLGFFFSDELDEEVQKSSSRNEHWQILNWEDKQ